MDREEKIMYALLLLVCAIGVYGTALGVQQSRTESTCFAAGYPGAKIDYAFNGYCVKRVDQTDVVVPVGRARP